MDMTHKLKPCMQVLMPLHAALQSVGLSDPLLRVSVGLRLALHLEAAGNPATAATVLQQVGASCDTVPPLGCIHKAPLLAAMHNPTDAVPSMFTVCV